MRKPTAIGLVLAACSLQASADAVRISTFLNDLAKTDGFTVRGIEIIGNETFEPAPGYKSTEEAVTRALRRFNHVVTYRNCRPVIVAVVGRKGNDVGALPETVPEQPPTN